MQSQFYCYKIYYLNWKCEFLWFLDDLFAGKCCMLMPLTYVNIAQKINKTHIFSARDDAFLVLLLWNIFYEENKGKLNVQVNLWKLLFSYFIRKGNFHRGIFEDIMQSWTSDILIWLYSEKQICTSLLWILC